jgi:hypothetical protein
MTYSQRQRLAFIDWRLLTAGAIRRAHIAEMFDVSEAQASVDLNEFIRLYPEVMRYDKTAKQYVPASFDKRSGGRYRSVMGWTARRVETWAAAAAAGVPWAWSR